MDDFELKPAKFGKTKVIISPQVRGILTRHFDYKHFNLVFANKTLAQNEIKRIKKQIKRGYKGNLIIDLT
jgi:hypothetical protein